MDVEAFVEQYYESLRDEEPLESYFAEERTPVKFGVTEALHGCDSIADGLQEQTRTTTNWTIDSHRLETDAVDDAGWFSDHVTMAWHKTDSDESVSWETRWSGTLVRRDASWAFVRMHVSATADQ